ncbi:LEF-10 [Chrysodeixis chalcites nucleopolyhedrovirus]|uniref:LEF-10 n=1 Tax=Chrysodeixis chalcites nucleopolyhedrovirus TaxID=320432 RepID=Q4KT36_9ABAC|nr:LEF-10 [Chrysodeixis chalcites nucleopolyhedrovirus]AGC36258.1 LEF-10 protein [Chrysodeixis chalcites SNPV TF1-A]AAY83975.1 LEF-10 [Chrysodeixis chalcites nucleopolyhedrovirus]AGE61305.1 LEF-10 [Chrysodeixis chalcites nucleopolyhedrovirus]AGE61454.1 LEF-10 [Chrysodeixis chalcites nucleopolyhedrovirus]AGE61603.1 LEF-10 [Chrysodeixis chalcites nucleopolyhedrovirus]
MSASPFEADVIDIILKNNLELVDNTYIILNVIDGKRGGSIKPVCLGEINSFQTHQDSKCSMSDSSVTSELQSDRTL